MSSFRFKNAYFLFNFIMIPPLDFIILSAVNVRFVLGIPLRLAGDDDGDEKETFTHTHKSELQSILWKAIDIARSNSSRLLLYFHCLALNF